MVFDQIEPIGMKKKNYIEMKAKPVKIVLCEEFHDLVEILKQMEAPSTKSVETPNQ